MLRAYVPQPCSQNVQPERCAQPDKNTGLPSANAIHRSGAPPPTSFDASSKRDSSRSSRIAAKRATLDLALQISGRLDRSGNAMGLPTSTTGIFQILEGLGQVGDVPRRPFFILFYWRGRGGKAVGKDEVSFWATKIRS